MRMRNNRRAPVLFPFFSYFHPGQDSEDSFLEGETFSPLALPSSPFPSSCPDPLPRLVLVLCRFLSPFLPSHAPYAQ